MTGQPKYLFVVGCVRSGTTWVQLLLAQHPWVATTQETHTFNHYLGILDRWWRGEMVQPDRRRTGLTHLLSEDDFYNLCRDFATGVMNKIAGLNPESRVVVEKSPDHVRSADFILRLFPDAYFMHVIRDPRSVVSSLRRAGETWGQDWAPTSTLGCAERWRHDVSVGRRIAGLTDRYLEVKYEELLRDTPGGLGSMLEWLDLPFEDGFCEDAAAKCAIDNLKKGSATVATPWKLGSEPQGMYHKGSADSWREELSRRDLRGVEYIAGPLMRELGYEPVFGGRSRPPVGWLVRDRLKALARRARPLWNPVVSRLNEAVRAK
jgi:hypothetical protein